MIKISIVALVFLISSNAVAQTKFLVQPLVGINAPTDGSYLPVLFKFLEPPFGVTQKFKRIHIITVAMGHIEDTRVVFAVCSISFQCQDGRRFNKKINGTIVGMDGLAGLSGKVIISDGTVVPKNTRELVPACNNNKIGKYREPKVVMGSFMVDKDRGTNMFAPEFYKSPVVQVFSGSQGKAMLFLNDTSIESLGKICDK